MTLKLRATHLAPPAYAHLKEFVVVSGNWQIGSISEERAGKGWFWALGVGTPFDPDKVKMHGSHVDSLDEAKRQFQVAWEMYGRTLLSGNETGEALAAWAFGAK
jgi:hypothetical protein